MLNLRRAAALPTLLFFTANTVLAAPAESNFWKDRQPRMAQLMPPAALPSALLSDLPAARPIAALQPRADQIPSRVSDDAMGRLLASLPLTHVSIREAHDAGPGHPAVVLIQDVHLNPEAQANIGETLERLVNGKAIERVGVEGAFSNLNFSRLDGFSDRKLVSDVAEDYLKAGLLAAPSFAGAALGPSRTAEITGVDDRNAYDLNVAAYRSAVKLQPAFASLLNGFDRRLSDLKRRHYGPDLAGLDGLSRAYQNGDIGLGPYLTRLVEVAGRRPDAVRDFLEAYAIEKKLDFSRVEIERRRILEKLAAAMTAGELRNLLDSTVAYRTGAISLGEFHGRLKSLCREKGIDLAQAPSFDSYLRYVLLADGIRAEALITEEAQLEAEAFGRLATTDAQRAIVLWSRRADLFRRLATFALSADEWDRFRTDAVTPAAFDRALGALDSAPATAALPDMGPFADFYRLADQRSETIVRRLLEGQPAAAALVVGGFHTPRVARLLEKRGCSLVVCSPRLTRVDLASGSAYLTVFSRDKTPVEKLFAGERLFINPTVVNFGADAGLERQVVGEAAARVGFGESAGTVPPDVRQTRIGALVRVVIDGVSVFYGRTRAAARYVFVGGRVGRPGGEFVPAGSLWRQVRLRAAALWAGAMAALTSATRWLARRINRTSDVDRLLRTLRASGASVVPNATVWRLRGTLEGGRARWTSSENRLRADRSNGLLVEADEGDLVILELAPGENGTIASANHTICTSLQMRAVDPATGRVLISHVHISPRAYHLDLVRDALQLFNETARSRGFSSAELAVNWSPTGAFVGEVTAEQARRALPDAIRAGESGDFVFELKSLEERRGGVNAAVTNTTSVRDQFPYNDLDRRKGVKRMRTETPWSEPVASADPADPSAADRARAEADADLARAEQQAARPADFATGNGDNSGATPPPLVASGSDDPSDDIHAFSVGPVADRRDALNRLDAMLSRADGPLALHIVAALIENGIGDAARVGGTEDSLGPPAARVIQDALGRFSQDELFQIAGALSTQMEDLRSRLTTRIRVAGRVTLGDGYDQRALENALAVSADLIGRIVGRTDLSFSEVPTHTSELVQLELGDTGHANNLSSFVAEGAIRAMGRVEFHTPESLPDLSAALPVEPTELAPLFARAGFTNPTFERRLGRTLVFKDGGSERRLALKIARPGLQDAGKLDREARLMLWLASPSGDGSLSNADHLGLESQFPNVAGGALSLYRISPDAFTGDAARAADDAERAFNLPADGGYLALAYVTRDGNYFRYATEPGADDALFRDSVRKATRDLFRLARVGIFHTSLVDIFHTVDTATGRDSQDGGRYLLLVDLIRRLTAFSLRPAPDKISRLGAGRLRDPAGAAEFPNERLTAGLADLGDVATMRELLEEGRAFAPFFAEARTRGRFSTDELPALYAANFLGEYLLAAVLMSGVRLARESGAEGAWQDDARMAELGGFYHDLFADGIAAYTGMNRDDAMRAVGSPETFTEMARQVALFMTSAHASLVRPGPAGQRDDRADRFPANVFPRSRVTFRPFRPGSLQSVGLTDVVSETGGRIIPSWGPVNGPLPLEIRPIVFTALESVLRGHRADRSATLTLPFWSWLFSRGWILRLVRSPLAGAAEPVRRARVEQMLSRLWARAVAVPLLELVLLPGITMALSPLLGTAAAVAAGALLFTLLHGIPSTRAGGFRQGWSAFAARLAVSYLLLFVAFQPDLFIAILTTAGVPVPPSVSLALIANPVAFILGGHGLWNSFSGRAARRERAANANVARAVVALLVSSETPEAAYRGIISLFTAGTSPSLRLGQTLQGEAPLSAFDPKALAAAVSLELAGAIRRGELTAAQANAGSELLSALLALPGNGAGARMVAASAIPEGSDGKNDLDVFRWLSPNAATAVPEAEAAAAHWRAQTRGVNDRLVLMVPEGQKAAIEASLSGRPGGMMGIVVLEAARYDSVAALLREVGGLDPAAIATRRLRFIVRNDSGLPPGFFDLAASGLPVESAEALQRSLEIYLIVSEIAQAVRIDGTVLPSFEAMRTIMVQA